MADFIDFENSKQGLVETFAVQRPTANDIITDRISDPITDVMANVTDTAPISTAIKRNENRAQALAPVTFDPAINVKLPENVRQSISETTAAAQAARDTQRDNNAAMLQTLLEANSDITEAQDRLTTINRVPFSEVIGWFNDDFNADAQKQIITEAQQAVIQQGKINQIKQQNSLLNVEDALAPVKEYESIQQARKGMLNNVSAQMNAIMQSNAASKAYTEWAVDQINFADLETMQKTKEFPPGVSPGAVRSAINKQKNIDLDLQALELANSQKSLNLKNSIEDRLLLDMSQRTVENLVDKAKASGRNVIELKNGQTISINKAMDAVSTKSKSNQERLKEINSFARMAVENNSAFTAAQRDASAVSNISNQTGVQVDTRGYGLLNTTVESLQGFDFNQINPHIRTEYTNVMLYAAELNAKESVTEKDIQLQQTLQSNLDKKIAELKTMQIENAPDKQTERLVKEMHTNGQISNGKNASAGTLSLVGGTPNFAGDAALQKAFKTFSDNVLAGAGGGAGQTFTDEDGNIDINAILASRMKAGTQTKTSIVQDAMRKKDANGNTPASLYASTKASTVMWAALKQLEQDFPQIKNTFFDAQGRGSDIWITQGGGQDHGRVAITLAELSKQETGQTGPGNNFLNIKLGDIINKLISDNASQWNSQINLDRGSFMVNMFTSGQPHELVDNALQFSYFNIVNDAWDGNMPTGKSQWDVSAAVQEYGFENKTQERVAALQRARSN